MTKAILGANAIGRTGMKDVEGYELKEPQTPYNLVFDPEKCGNGNGDGHEYMHFINIVS